MHNLYELRDTLCEELAEYSKKRDNLDMNALDVIDKLAHAVKNIDKIIACEEGGNSYGNSYGYSRNEGNWSMARGRGSYANRDSRGRYSSDMSGDFRRLMENAPDEQTRAELGRMMQRYE